MSDGTTFSNIQGDFKDAYAGKEKDLVPASSVITKAVEFVSSDKEPGNTFKQPVILTSAQGVTFAGPDDDYVNLNEPVSMTMKFASLTGSQVWVKEGLSNNIISRSKNNSFKQATKLVVANALKSHSKYVELVHMYGHTNVGIATSSANVDTTSTVITLSLASWSDMIWSGAEGTRLSLFKQTDATILNANAALSITAVDIAARSITVSGNATDIGDIDIYLATADDAEVNFYGSRASGNVYSEAVGVQAILENTGTLFGISAAQYDLWRANTFTAGNAALTQAKLDEAVATAVGRGLGENVDVLVNPKTWSNLNTDQAAKRYYDESYSDEGKNGFRTLKFLSQNGVMNIIPTPFMKQGQAFVIPLEDFNRVGSQETAFDNLGNQPGEFLTQMENKTGYYFRTYSNEAILGNRPATCTLITNIVNTI